MATFKEENAITYRIGKMQKKWATNVKKETKLVRWLIDKDEDRMVKAFTLIEASEYGKVSALFVNFENYFNDIETYGKELTETFVALFNNKEARAEIAHENVLPNWNDSIYKDIEIKDSYITFLECMSSFASAVSNEITLVLNIMPHGYNGDKMFVKWLEKCLEVIPSNIKLMIVDLKDSQLFSSFEEPQMLTLEANLNMNQAMKEIVTSGDTNNPVVGLNLHILNIMEALAKKNEKQVHHYAKKAMKSAKETTLKSLEATVLLTYGSALYQLKKLDKALQLFQEAEKTSIEGLETTDTACATLLLQSYNFQAATYYYKKKKDKAEEYYLKTATEAKSQNNQMLFLEASRMTAYTAKKNYRKEEAFKILKQAYQEGLKLDTETQKFSSMLLICIDLYDFAKRKEEEKELTENIEKHAVKVWGEKWQNISQKEVYQNILTT